MIYITGDTHGDMNRIVRFCERMETSQEDIMIQKLESVGIIEPFNAKHMYFAAMNATGCKLTELGKYYWKLLKEERR